jgi:hypothetical protein
MIYAEHIISHVNVQNASVKSHLPGRGRSVGVLGLVLGSEGGVDSLGWMYEEVRSWIHLVLPLWINNFMLVLDQADEFATWKLKPLPSAVF